MAEGHCRASSGYMNREIFESHSCLLCYSYLFPSLSIPGPSNISGGRAENNHSTLELGVTTLDLHGCFGLSVSDCGRWKQCCSDAKSCCQRQLLLSSTTANGIVHQMCPITWDGFACWDSAMAQTESLKSCPRFLENVNDAAFARKNCTQNGTWFISPEGAEWSDYSKCVMDVQQFHLGMSLAVACNVISIIFLLPAICIFLVFRQLRSQHRIRLHINLCASFLVTSFFSVLWDLIVFRNRLLNHDSVMHQNTLGCKLLYILVRYSRSTNYLWMLCEALYLHQLLVKAFEPPKWLVPFYITGWGFPWIPLVVYSIIRILSNADYRCWVSQLGAAEWLIYVPNLISLTANLVILVNILRILLLQVQPHPNEPNNYRRALRATFVLVPLFGLQQFIIIYNPPGLTALSNFYTVISILIINSQGILVASIFCFFNGEVLSLIKKSWVHCRQEYFDGKDIGSARRQDRSLVSSTNMTSDTARVRTSPTYLPLTVCNGNSHA